VNDIITAQQLNETLQALHDKHAYAELVFYLEACESGSMFEDILPEDANILAITASNATESSWGTYCDDPVLDTCLGDLFSINWMQDSDKEDLNKEILREQFAVVKKRTDLSNVMKYGDNRISGEIVGNFQGARKVIGSKQVRAMRESSSSAIRWPSKEIPLRTVEARLRRTTDPAKREQLTKQLEEMKIKRAYHDMHTRALIQKVMHDRTEAERELILQRRPTKISDLACHHKVVTAYHQECFNLGKNPYAMWVAGPLNNLCESGFKADRIIGTMKSHCVHKNKKMQDIH